MGTFPNKSTQFQPGQTGNPGGYSRERRLQAALHELFDEDPTLLRDLVTALAGKAAGRKDVLKGRRPSLAYIQEVRSWIEGSEKGSGDASPPGALDVTPADMTEAASRLDAWRKAQALSLPKPEGA